MQHKIQDDRQQQCGRKKKLHFHELRSVAVLDSLAWIFANREYPPEGELVFLFQIFGECVGMSVVNDSVGSELHLPATRRHAIREFDILRTGDRKRSIVTAHLNETLTTKCRRVRV